MFVGRTVLAMNERGTKFKAIKSIIDWWQLIVIAYLPAEIIIIIQLCLNRLIRASTKVALLMTCLFNLEKGIFELLSRELGLDSENGWLSSLNYKLLLTQQAIERRLNRSHSWNYLMAATEDMNLPFGKYTLVVASLVNAL